MLKVKLSRTTAITYFKAKFYYQTTVADKKGKY